MTRKKTEKTPVVTEDPSLDPFSHQNQLGHLDLPVVTQADEVAYERTILGQTIKVVLDRKSKAARILAILLEQDNA